MKHITILLLIISFNCLGQNKVFRKFSRIKYDSVKIFSFNYDSKINLRDYGLLNDTSLVDAHQNWAHTVSKVGFELSEDDITGALSVIKIFKTDNTDSDPMGCYTPRMGIVYFRKEKAIAHIDICLECSKIMIEIFNENYKVLCNNPPETMGGNTFKFFQNLCIKYKLKYCN